MNLEAIKNQVDLLRQKALRGEMSFEEVKAAVAFCREQRLKTGTSRPPTVAKPAKPATSVVPKLSAEDLLGGL
jgi:hypothetical protein